MYRSNYHSHCIFCDGRSPMEDFVKFAIAKGVKSYGFSSHAPLPFLTKWTMIEDDFPEYQMEFERLKQKYKNKIDLYLGLEVDFINHCSSIENNFFKDIKLDYLIGSIHYLDKISNDNYWSIDNNFNEFNEGLNLLYDGDINQAARRFFEISRLMIDKGGFDIVGHVDKIAYNGRHYKDFDIKQQWYKNQVGETFQKIKEKGMILEINTKSVSSIGITYPHQQFFPLINELEIPITVNSDCHYPTNIIDGFNPTYKILKKAGFKSMQLLKNNKWEAAEINEEDLKNDNI